MAALLAVVSSVVWGFSDFIGGLASRRSTPLQTVALTTPAGLVTVLPVAFLFGGDRLGSALPGIAAGTCGGLAILMLYSALSLGPMGVVSPVAAVLGAAVPVTVGLLRGDRPGPAAYVGMLLAVVAIITVGLEPTAPTDDSGHQRITPRALLLSIGAGLGIGGFFTFLAFAPSGSGLWPTVWARGASTVLVLTIGLVVSRSNNSPMMPPLRSVRLLAVVAGVVDLVANAFYVLALQVGLLSIVAVLGSLYPAVTVLMARFLLAERLRPTQKVGMVTALVASALLAAGS